MATDSKFVSQEQWEAKKAEAIANEPVSKVLNIAQLGLANDSLAKNYVLVDGKEVAVADSFWNHLCKVLGFNKTLLGKVNEVDKQKLVGAALLEGLTRLLSNYKGKNSIATIHGDFQTKCLTHINSGGIARLTNKGLFEQAEELLNKYSYLSPKSIEVSPNGNTSIQLLSTNELAFSKVGEDEVFNFGFSMGNNGNATQLGNFIYRLVCSNGMMGLKTAWDYTLADTSTNSLMAMQAYIHQASKNMFVPDKFADNLALAAHTKASFAEVEKAYQFLVDKIENTESDTLRDHYKFVIGDKHIYGYNRTHAKLRAKGINPQELNPKMKERVRTDMTVWDLVNALTYIGSHDIGIPISNKARLLREGGKIFYGDYDLAYFDMLQ